MAEKKLNVRFKQRIDTKENWESANPVLYEGEIAAVKVGDQVYFKIGDGTNNFSNLPITQSIAADVYDWAKAATKPTYGVSEITGLSTELAKKADAETASGGFIGGNGSDASTGAAVGSGASAIEGGAVGESAVTGSGFAGGQGAFSANGVAIGQGAKTSDGFAGGLNAKTVDDMEEPIDAIQLGTGTNSAEKTFQVYDYKMMDASGNIPAARLANAPKTTVEDVLTSTSATNALSANQGKVLKGLIDNIEGVTDLGTLDTTEITGETLIDVATTGIYKFKYSGDTECILIVVGMNGSISQYLYDSIGDNKYRNYLDPSMGYAEWCTMATYIDDDNNLGQGSGGVISASKGEALSNRINGITGTVINCAEELDTVSITSSSLIRYGGNALYEISYSNGDNYCLLITTTYNSSDGTPQYTIQYLYDAQLGAKTRKITYNESGEPTATSFEWEDTITPVVDNLTSESTTSALSANQGKVLKGLIDAISADYLSKSTGGAISGDVSFSGAVTSANPVSVGAPTADGHAATKSYVDTEINSKIAAADALIFKGAVDPASFPGSLASCKTGWTYKASAAGTIFTDIKVEIGDMIIAIADCDSAAAVANKNNWTVIQANLDGTVTGPKSATSDSIAVFDGTTGKLIKDGSKKISDLALKTEVDAVDTKVGTLNSLTTTDKTSIVNAVNEVKSGVTAVSGAPTSVEAGSGLTASIADNKLSIAFDDSITFVLEAGGASIS